MHVRAVAIAAVAALSGTSPATAQSSAPPPSRPSCPSVAPHVDHCASLRAIRAAARTGFIGTECGRTASGWLSSLSLPQNVCTEGHPRLTHWDQSNHDVTDPPFTGAENHELFCDARVPTEAQRRPLEQSVVRAVRRCFPHATFPDEVDGEPYIHPRFSIDVPAADGGGDTGLDCEFQIDIAGYASYFRCTTSFDATPSSSSSPAPSHPPPHR